MKKLLVLSLMLILIMGLSTTGLFAQEHEGETLVVGVWGGVIEELIRENVVQPLEEETGANVELLLGGTGDRMSKLQSERSNPTMDIAYLNIYEAPQAMRDGLVQKPDHSLDVYDELYEVAHNDGGYGMSMMGLGIVYNTNVFDEPPQWEDLWKDEYKGKIAFPNYPSSEGDGFLAVAARLAGGDEHDPDLAFEKLKELKPIPLVYRNLDELFMMMEKGDVVAAPLISGYAYTYKEKGFPVDFSWPTDPGPVKMMDVLTIVKNNDNNELARKFANLALGVENQTAYAKEIYFGPTNKNVELPEEVAEKVIYGEEQVETLLDLDWEYIINQRPDWTNRWNKEIVD